MNNNSQSFGGLVFHQGEGLTSKNFKKQCSREELQQLEQILKNPKLLDNLNL
jgi:predicted nuclease of restriction endonuclease-like (RecB) superfamily